MNRRLLLTGGFGFIGLRIAERFLDEGWAVDIVDERAHLTRYFQARLPIARRMLRVVSRCRNLWDLGLPSNLDKCYDLLVHCGAVSATTATGDELFLKNIDWTRSLLNEWGHTERIIFISSGAVYGDGTGPLNLYGLTKSVGERMFWDNDPSREKTTVLRPFNVYGEDEHHKGAQASLVFKLCASAVAGRTEDVFGMNYVSRDWVYVGDVVRCVWNSYLVGVLGTYDVGGETANVQELVEMTGCQTRVVDMPEELKGRYQFSTKAGEMDPDVKPYTRSGIQLEEGIERVKTALQGI